MKLTRTRRALTRLGREIEKTYQDEVFAQQVKDRDLLQNTRVRRAALMEAVNLIAVALESDLEVENENLSD